ncbi:hypothetical protein D1007_21264 [Hordeum vulgare]|nr:hypothetical protein D1007_21264 [Hordeum vulgare]
MEFNSLGFLFLRCGWKSFALAQGLQDGHVLHFKFDKAATPFLKFYGSVGGRLDSCMKDSSSRSSGPSGPEHSGSSSSSSRSRGDSDSDGSLGAHVKEEEDSY